MELPLTRDTGTARLEGYAPAVSIVFVCPFSMFREIALHSDTERRHTAVLLLL